MKTQDPVLQKIKEKQHEISEEKQLTKKKNSINKLALSASLVLLLVTLISLIRIIFNIIN